MYQDKDPIPPYLLIDALQDPLPRLDKVKAKGVKAVRSKVKPKILELDD